MLFLIDSNFTSEVQLVDVLENENYTQSIYVLRLLFFVANDKLRF